MNDEKQNNDSGMLLRAAMSAIPALAPLAAWWSEFNSTKNAKRLQVLIDTLNALVACHSRELDAINKDTSKFEERIAILEVTLDKVVKEWQQDKIKKHAKLLIQNLISNDPIQLKMSILERFSELTLEDLNILEPLSISSSVQVKEFHISLDELIPILSKLESRGLITQTGHGNRGIWTMASSDNWREQWLNRFYTATPFGRKLWNSVNSIKQE